MTTKKHRRAALSACLVVVALVSAACVSGPLPPGPRIPAELAPAGFVEHEYFIDGQARSYAPVGTWTSDGVWAAETTGSAAYRTRVIVRRPAEAADFNGTVVLDWVNVTAQFENAVTSLEARERYNSLGSP